MFNFSSLNNVNSKSNLSAHIHLEDNDDLNNNAKAKKKVQNRLVDDRVLNILRYFYDISNNSLNVLKFSVWHQTNAPVMAESDTNLVPNMAEVMTEVPHLHQLNLAPAEADFLIAHSTMPGYVSFRNDRGSFFVQSLVKHLKAHSPRYILNLS